MKGFTVQSIYKVYQDLIRNPKYRWWVIGGSLLYLLSPFDVSPDLFPVVGWLDDGVIIGLLVAEVTQLLRDRLQSAKAGAGETATTTAQPEGPVGDAQATETVDVKASAAE